MRYRLPDDFEKITEALSDEEAGRLLRAMLAYINRNEVIALTGAERVLFPQMQKDMDTFLEKMAEISKTRSASGKLGGRPKKANESKQKQTKANESKCFFPPTPEEVEAYCNENGFWVDANQFCDYYKSKGWKIGSASMKDWRATVRNWNRREQERRRGQEKPQEHRNGYDIVMEILQNGEIAD